MSTVENAVETAVAVVEYTKDEAIAKFGTPPNGQRYMLKAGKVVIGNDGLPVAVAKKKSTTRTKKSKARWTVPTGGCQSSVTEGFTPGVHASLKESDFADVLHYHQWRVWYYGELAKSAAKDAEAISQLGSTAEERKEAKEELRMLKALENMMAKRKASGNSSAAARLLEKMGETFASLQME